MLWGAWVRRQWPAAVLTCELVAVWLWPRGGWWTVLAALVILLGLDQVARHGMVAVGYRVGQTIVGLVGAVVAVRWLGSRVGPWLHAPPTWWHIENEVLVGIAASTAAILLLVALFGGDTPGGRALRTWWRWVRCSAGRTDYLGPVVLGRAVGPVWNRPVVVWEGDDRYRNLVVIGAPGTGKTSMVMGPIAFQDLMRMVQRGEIGLTVFEPKGEFAERVYDAARALGLRAVLVDPRRADSAIWNPLEGDPDKVAESVRTVLQTMFGRQDAFFGNAQESASRNMVLLLKALRGDNLTFVDVLEHLWDQNKLVNAVAAYERLPNAHQHLAMYFRNIVLKNPKWQEHTLGLQIQMQDLVINHSVNRVLSGKSSFNIDAHLADGGGVLCVGTALGDLSSKMGGLFGRLLLMSFQDAIFRRPGVERTRKPHVLLVDEAPMFINPRFGELLSMGRSYRVSTVLAFQDLAQLELWSQGEGGKAFANTVLANCQSRMMFGGGTQEDALWFSRQLGMSPEVEKTQRVDSRGGSGESRRVIDRTRVGTTSIIEQRPGHAWLQLVRHGQIQPPVQIVGSRPRWPQPKRDQAMNLNTDDPAATSPLVEDDALSAPDAQSRAPTVKGVMPAVYVDLETGEVLAAATESQSPAVEPEAPEEVPF